MPAMSPTMTEGNIANWKVKEGDSFSTGDVILEIETDKATMDVEAQDDGIMAKIIQPDGTKSVQVGTRIAVLADEGDDLQSLEIPPEDHKPAPKADQKQAKPDASSEQIQPKPSEPSSSKLSTPPPSGASQSNKYPLYPSVTALLHEKHIPDSEIPKIPATGPNGRLLKGDVLAYLGSIESSYSSTQSKRIDQLSHLDLSNVKLASPTPPSDAKPVTAAAPAPPPPPPSTVSISLPISLIPVLSLQKRLQESLGISIPLSSILARATDLANHELPRTKAMRESSADLFNAIVGLEALNPLTSPGGYIPEIASIFPPLPPASPSPRSANPTEPDIIDILSGKVNVRPSSTLTSAPTPPKPTVSSQPPPPPPQSSSTAAEAEITARERLNVFTLTVPMGEEKRARTFLERMKTVLQVEPGRLVL